MRNLGGYSAQKYFGHTPEGKRCALQLTDKYGGIFYVTVGYNRSEDLEDYVGVTINQSKIQIGANALAFSADQSWGNSSQRNNVTIDVDKNRTPIHAKGVSDLQSIDCELDATPGATS
ncbi:MAG: hypothetical protein ACXVA9_07560 [Bdellovibrionales bacterium]